MWLAGRMGRTGLLVLNNFLLRNDTIAGDMIAKISKFLGISPQSNMESESSAAHELGHEMEGGT